MLLIPAVLGEDVCISTAGAPTCCALPPNQRMGLKVEILGVVTLVLSQRLPGSHFLWVSSGLSCLGQLGGPQCHHLQQCGPIERQQGSSLGGFQPLLPHPWIMVPWHLLLILVGMMASAR